MEYDELSEVEVDDEDLTRAFIKKLESIGMPAEYKGAALKLLDWLEFVDDDYGGAILLRIKQGV
jgi:hypothetical protein